MLMRIPPKVHEITDTVYSREVYLLLKISQNNSQLPVYAAMEVVNDSIQQLTDHRYPIGRWRLVELIIPTREWAIDNAPTS